MRQAFAEGFRGAGYEVLNAVVLNQVLVSFGDDETTATDHKRHTGRGNMLVRRYGLEGTQGYAN